jgi:hypothetical protein
MKVISVFKYLSPNPDRAEARKEFFELAKSTAAAWNNRIPTEKGIHVRMLIIGIVHNVEFFEMAWVLPENAEEADLKVLSRKYLMREWLETLPDEVGEYLNGFAI